MAPATPLAAGVLAMVYNYQLSQPTRVPLQPRANERT
jgi:hypothetical protein